MAYTVDEVSDLLGVPRPTLYRYLREYSIPHLRRLGKIYVPEESFDRIKEVRELHKEGLGTESVRKRLREESAPDVDGLTERLDRISETLESLKGNLKSANGVSSAQALQTILARQSLLISAVSNLTEMLEDLLHANGWRRQAAFGDPEEQDHKEVFSGQLEKPLKTAEHASISGESDLGVHSKSSIAPARRKRFGSMAKRRRRIALAVLLALFASTVVVAYAALSNKESPETSQEEPATLSQETRPADSEEAPAEAPNAAPQSPVAYEQEGHEGLAPEQSFYQRQDAAPEPPSQGVPVPPSQPDNTPSPVVYPPVLAQ